MFNRVVSSRLKCKIQIQELYQGMHKFYSSTQKTNLWVIVYDLYYIYSSI